ncbi:MAG: YbaN family protein [Bacteriovoracaceae bacterium]
MTKQNLAPDKGKRTLYLILGHLCVGLGIIGVLLPVIPATPFMILAAYFYSQSSPELHQKILNLPHVGSHVKAWEDHGVINKKAKTMSILTLTLMIGSSIYFLKNIVMKIVLSMVALVVAYFIFSRPSEKK